MSWTPSVNKPYQIPPAGLFVATCCDFAERGSLVNPFTGKIEKKVSIHFVIDEIDENGKAFIPQRWFTDTLSEKGNLRPFIESWFGKTFSDKEVEQLREEDFLGRPGQIQITHKVKQDGKTRAEIKSIMPLAKGQANPDIPKTYVRVKDRPPHDERTPF